MSEVMQMLSSGPFWLDVLKIIVIDIMLSGDNAVVIALACRSLPDAQRKKGIFYGVLGAIALRITLTFFAVSLLSLPYLKMAGALMLLWIGVKLILPEDEHDASNVQAATRLWGAVRTILIADFIMSLDNVLGVAAAAHGSVLLLAFGLLVSIPLVAWSSQLVLKVLDRFPFVIYLGGGAAGLCRGRDAADRRGGQACAGTPARSLALAAARRGRAAGGRPREIHRPAPDGHRKSGGPGGRAGVRLIPRRKQARLAVRCMKPAAPPEWNPAAMLQSPLFAPLHPWLARMDAARFPGLDDYNAMLAAHQPPIAVHSGKPLRFVAQATGKQPFAQQYEPRCYLKGEVQTRENNWHDLFNALVWLVFPQAKAAINARHYRSLTAPARPRSTDGNAASAAAGATC